MLTRLPFILALALQIAGTQPARFEVASVKPAAPGNGRISTTASPSGLYVATNLPLRLLIRNAFGLQLDSLVGPLPDWAESARYDINARAENAEPTIAQRRQMLQTLLSERFGLKSHTELRQVDGYALVRARKDGVLGKNLEQVPSADCDELLARIRRKEVPAVGPNGHPVHGMWLQGTTLKLACMPVRALVTNLMSHSHINRPIIDHTGLDGNVNLELSWGGDNAADVGPTVFSAVQEQLGLRLDTQRVPAEVLIVDQINRPALD
jgi:uncharacterized protein (TIGR03435 family)